MEHRVISFDWTVAYCIVVNSKVYCFAKENAKKEKEQEVRTNDSHIYMEDARTNTAEKRPSTHTKPVFLKSAQKLNHYRFWFSQAIFKGTVALQKCSRLNLMLLHVQLVSTFVCTLLSKRFRTRIQYNAYRKCNAFQRPAVSFTCFISFFLFILFFFLAKAFNSSDTYTCLVFVLHCHSGCLNCWMRRWIVYHLHGFPVFMACMHVHVHVLCDAVIHGIQNDHDHVLRAAFQIY